MTALLEQYLEHVHRITSFRSGKMEVGKVRSTLLRQQGFNGEVMSRHLYAEKRVAAGNVEIDWKRKRYKNTANDTFMDFSGVTLALVDYTDWLMQWKADVSVTVHSSIAAESIAFQFEVNSGKGES